MGEFNRPLDNLPKTLKILILGSNFNQPLNNLPGIENIDLINERQKVRRKNLNENRKNEKQIYNGLEKLQIYSRTFNQPVNNLPPTLKQFLIDGVDFNQPINKLPFSVLLIDILSENFNQPLDNLPCRLKDLTIDSKLFNNSTNYLPNTITDLYILSKQFTQPFTTFPKQLTNLQINCPLILQLSLTKLPPKLKILNTYENQQLKNFIISMQYSIYVSGNLRIV